MTTPRGKGRPSLEAAAEIDIAIRDAALRILLEQGEAATLNGVAIAAGLSRRTLYARYPNKVDLFVQVIRDLLQSAGNLEYDKTGDVEDRLRHYIEAAFQAISRPQSQAMQRLLSIDPTYIGALKSEMLDATRRIFRDPLLALLQDAVVSGEIEAGDLEGTARVVIRSVFTESLVIKQDPDSSAAHADPSDFAGFLARLIVRGLKPR